MFSDVQLPLNLHINDECYTLVCTADGTPACDGASKIAYMRDKGNYDEYFPQLHLLQQLTLNCIMNSSRVLCLIRQVQAYSDASLLCHGLFFM